MLNLHVESFIYETQENTKGLSTDALVKHVAYENKILKLCAIESNEIFNLSREIFPL